ncbi:hypothetical protein [Roseimaritima sediminicola]|uniref:hypothetical protein n=1 Tax=Roseimaritima sediminicola TaxID=2662066 RepID=UPI00129830EF|nr:hypothetical protein [Roseimaritima sediminicola]
MNRLSSFASWSLWRAALHLWMPAVLAVCAGGSAGAVDAAVENPDSDPSGTRAAAGSDAPVSVEVAFDGQYRLGQWTALRVERSGYDGPLTLETIDGDGVRVRYVDDAATSHQDNASAAAGNQVDENNQVDESNDAVPARLAEDSAWRYVVCGAASAPLWVRDDRGRLLVKTRFPDQPIAIEQRRVLILGDPMGIDEIGKNELLGRDAKLATTVVEDVDTLPDHWLGYDSVDTLVVTATAWPLLEQMDERVRDAILTWVRRGGRVLVTIGQSGPEAYQHSRLIRELIPLQDVPLLQQMEPAPIEAFISAQQRLDVFPAAVLPLGGAQPMLIGRTVQRRSLAVAMRYQAGLGEVLAVAADLDRPPFAAWPSRTDLLLELMPDLVPAAREPSSRGRRSDTHYNDLAGQLRATLDRFSAAGAVPFSVIAVGLLALFLVIGPLDYLLINRWLKRPLAGWVSFPLVILVCSVALILWARRGQQSPAQTNRIEFVDINAVEGVGRGYRVDYLYTPRAERLDVGLEVEPGFAAALDGPFDNGPLLAPFAYSGATFGGVQIAVEDQRLPAYQVRMRRSGDRLQSRAVDVPIAAGGSKGFDMRWTFSFASSARQGLWRRRTELAGRLENPLPVDILDGMLLDRDKVYFLPSRFRAGATIARVEELRPRVLRWFLTGRKRTEDATVSERYDPADDTDLRRVSEMLGFYRIAGGESYTGLLNRPLGELDLSGIVTDRRALLIGRLEQPTTRLTVRQHGGNVQSDGESDSSDSAGGEGDAPVVQPQQEVSVVRILLPILQDRPEN